MTMSRLTSESDEGAEDRLGTIGRIIGIICATGTTRADPDRNDRSSRER
jgi:hypothetical protein